MTMVERPYRPSPCRARQAPAEAVQAIDEGTNASGHHRWLSLIQEPMFSSQFPQPPTSTGSHFIARRVVTAPARTPAPDPVIVEERNDIWGEDYQGWSETREISKKREWAADKNSSVRGKKGSPERIVWPTLSHQRRQSLEKKPSLENGSSPKIRWMLSQQIKKMRMLDEAHESPSPIMSAATTSPPNPITPPSPIIATTAKTRRVKTSTPSPAPMGELPRIPIVGGHPSPSRARSTRVARSPAFSAWVPPASWSSTAPVTPPRTPTRRRPDTLPPPLRTPSPVRTHPAHIPHIMYTPASSRSSSSSRVHFIGGKTAATTPDKRDSILPSMVLPLLDMEDTLPSPDPSEVFSDVMSFSDAVDELYSKA